MITTTLRVDPDQLAHHIATMYCDVANETGSYDCGRIINPKTAASQFRGGIIMGIGLSLMEATEFDERAGRI